MVELNTNIDSHYEKALIEASKSNPEEFRELYELYHNPIFRFINNKVNDLELTADITSQVFLKALLNIKKFEHKGFPFSSWLYRVAINECNNYFRESSRIRHIVLEDDMTDLLFEELSDGLDKQEVFRRQLSKVLEKLKPFEVQLLELRFFEGKAFKEVGFLTGMTENNAKVKVYRVLKKMKKYFKIDESF